MVQESVGATPSRQSWTAPASGGFARKDDLVAWIRRRLCLIPDRDHEVAEALEADIVEHDGLFSFDSREVVTLWWPGSARKA